MSDAEFRAQLQASGMSYDELRKRARLDVEKAMMIEQEVRAKIDVPDADVKAYYDAHKEDFTIAKERLKLAQILIALPANPTRRASVRRAKKGRDDSRARSQGRLTSAISRACIPTTNQNPTAANSDGSRRPTSMDQILAVVKPLKPGEVSAPVRTSHGIHIVKLEEHEVPGVVPLSEVKAPIRAQLIDQQSSAQLEKWVESDLVKQHYVETMY